MLTHCRNNLADKNRLYTDIVLPKKIKELPVWRCCTPYDAQQDLCLAVCCASLNRPEVHLKHITLPPFTYRNTLQISGNLILYKHRQALHFRKGFTNLCSIFSRISHIKCRDMYWKPETF